MKKKQYHHPRIYLKILDKNKSGILLEYKDNEFDEFGDRTIKRCELSLPKSFDNLSNNFSQILNKLNDEELLKIDNYLKMQYKVLAHHKKNNNHDAFRVVLDSIELIKNFKLELLSYEL
jgi:hypothetical protein